MFNLSKSVKVTLTKVRKAIMWFWVRIPEKKTKRVRLYSISRVFGQRFFGEINMCELLILKLDLCLNVSDFTSIGQRWIHFLFNEKESFGTA